MSRNLLAMTIAAGLVASPALVLAQADGTPGNPPGTAASRALDAATGQPSIPDGAPGNPPGTALGRAVDRLTGQPTSPDGTGNNPPGTALDRAAERVGARAAETMRELTAPPAGPAIQAAPAMPAQPVGPAIVTPRPRMSQVIGARVYNAEGETIGSVEDVLIGTPERPLAVLQVGGFLGLGGRLVAVPLADLQWNAERERLILPGVTRDQLRERPEFRFAEVRGG